MNLSDCAADHALGQALGSVKHLPHGLTIGLVLAESLDLSRGECSDRLERVADALGEPPDGTERRFARGARGATPPHRRSTSRRSAEVGVTEDDLPALVASATGDQAYNLAGRLPRVDAGRGRAGVPRRARARVTLSESRSSPGSSDEPIAGVGRSSATVHAVEGLRAGGRSADQAGRSTAGPAPGVPSAGGWRVAFPRMPRPTSSSRLVSPTTAPIRTGAAPHPDRPVQRDAARDESNESRCLLPGSIASGADGATIPSISGGSWHIATTCVSCDGTLAPMAELS